MAVFLTEKGRANRQLCGNSWLSKLSFLVDITSHMKELDLKVQRKDKLACDLYTINCFLCSIKLFYEIL